LLWFIRSPDRSPGCERVVQSHTSLLGLHAAARTGPEEELKALLVEAPDRSAGMEERDIIERVLRRADKARCARSVTPRHGACLDRPHRTREGYSTGAEGPRRAFAHRLVYARVDREHSRYQGRQYCRSFGFDFGSCGLEPTSALIFLISTPLHALFPYKTE